MIFVDAHQKVTSAEEDANNQARGWPTLGTAVRLFPLPRLVSPYGLVIKCHGGRNGGYGWAQQEGPPLTSPAWLQSLMSAHLPAADFSAEPQIRQHSQRSVCHPVAGGFHWTTSSWKRHWFTLIGKDTLDLDLPSLYAMLLPELPSTDLQNTLPTIMLYYSALFLTKELTSQQKQHGNEPGRMEFTGSPPAAAAGLAEW